MEPCLGSGARSFTRRFLDQDTSPDRLHGPASQLHLTGGEASDCVVFESSLDIEPDIRPHMAATDKGYDSRANRDAARVGGITPIIPRRATAKDR